jgi:hypothetical protein
MSKDVLEALKEASRGLLYPSETDAPFEPFVWEEEEGKPDKARVLELIGRPEKTRAKVMSLNAFFRDVTQEEDWHDAEEKAEVRKFRELVQALKGALTDIKVFKVGGSRATCTSSAGPAPGTGPGSRPRWWKREGTAKA